MRARQVQTGIAHGLFDLGRAVVVVARSFDLAEAYGPQLFERAIIVLWQKFTHRIELEPKWHLQCLCVQAFID